MVEAGRLAPERLGPGIQPLGRLAELVGYRG
jgi:hypothetical protein